MDSNVKETVKKIAGIIADGINPNQIFLFGSYAQGTENPDSDLDIYVVTDLQNIKRVEIAQKARRLLIRKIAMPVDILVCDTKEFEIRKNNQSTLEYLVVTEGIKLYGD